jgi:hypothetical protein
MNFLPSIEVLSFLDWLDKKGIADLKDSTIEEFVLNPENNEKLLDTIDYYKKTRFSFVLQHGQRGSSSRVSMKGLSKLPFPILSFIS